MTEDEAKTKMCFRAATFGASQQLADGPGPHCIASGCMAWGWEDDEDEYRSVDHSTESFTAPAITDFKPPEGDEWRAHGQPFLPAGYGRQWRMHFKRPFGAQRRGFCGLARRSEVVVTMP